MARLSGFIFYGNGLLSHLLCWKIVRKLRIFSDYWLIVENTGCIVSPDPTIKKRLVYVSYFVATCALGKLLNTR